MIQSDMVAGDSASGRAAEGGQGSELAGQPVSRPSALAAAVAWPYSRRRRKRGSPANLVIDCCWPTGLDCATFRWRRMTQSISSLAQSSTTAAGSGTGMVEFIVVHKLSSTEIIGDRPNRQIVRNRALDSPGALLDVPGRRPCPTR